MRVHDLKDSEGRVFAFEVSNAIIGRSGACAIIAGIPGVFGVRRRSKGDRAEDRCFFHLQGQRFLVMEPFGDNPRYWVGPEPPAWCPQIELVRQAFLDARPWAVHLRAIALRVHGSGYRAVNGKGRDPRWLAPRFLVLLLVAPFLVWGLTWLLKRLLSW